MAIADSNYPVSQKVIQIADELGIKQRAVAQRAGFSSQQLNDMLNGRRLIKASDIPKLAKALNVAPNVLFEPNDIRQNLKLSSDETT